MQILIEIFIFLLLAVPIILNSGIHQVLQTKRAQKDRIREQREQVLGHTQSKLERTINTEKSLVKITRTNIKTYVWLLVASILGGLIFGRLVFLDTTVSMALAIICIVLPHAFLVLKHDRDSRSLDEKLESSMRIITHEYISTNDIITAVSNSIPVIEYSEPFKAFIVDCTMVSSNVERNLRRLERKVHNNFCSRWIDQLILTQSDHSQIPNLLPILDDMNDAKTAQRHNDTKVASSWTDYFTMLFIILLTPLLIRVIQREWYNYLIYPIVGRGLMIALLASLVWATARAININKTITG